MLGFTKEWMENELNLYDREVNKTAIVDIALRINHDLTTADITALRRLIVGAPLTGLENREEDWELIQEHDDGTKLWKHARYAALFRMIRPGKEPTYVDAGRVLIVNISNPTKPVHNDFLATFIDAADPIEFPYYPAIKPCVMYVDILGDPDDEDTWEWFWIHRVTKAKGGEIGLLKDLVYRRDENGKWVEGEKKDFVVRRAEIEMAKGEGIDDGSK